MTRRRRRNGNEMTIQMTTEVLSPFSRFIEELLTFTLRIS